MQVVEVQFQALLIDPEIEELLDVLLGLWRQHGQVLGRELWFIRQELTYRIFLMLPKADALDEKFNNQYARSTLEKIRAAGWQGPTVQLLEAESGEPCTCDSSHFILYTTYVALESCLRCGDCFKPLPLYTLPDQESISRKGALHDRIISWQSNYQACDQLQMNCEVGERFGLGEMSRHDSKLSQQGRGICEDISLSLQRPTYYYLHRYRGRSTSQELARTCPSCGGEWGLPERRHHRFDFQCDRCHLLSNIAMALP
jgi:predicted  nucleic acid-binding Zn ribbon protein